MCTDYRNYIVPIPEKRTIREEWLLYLRRNTTTMKTYSLILLLSVLTATSCTITKRRYTGGWHVEWNKRYKEQPAVTPHSNTEENNPLYPETNEDVFQKEQGISENTDVILKESFPADTVHRSKKSQQLKKLSRKTSQENETSDTQKEKKKWVPYKYRKQQEEQEDAERTQSEKIDEEIEEPSSRSALEIVISILGTLALVYLGYGSTVGLAALCLLIFDYSAGVGVVAYLATFFLAWILFAGVTAILLRLWIQKRSDESQASYRHRLWNYSMLIAVILALITVIVLGVVLFL